MTRYQTRSSYRTGEPEDHIIAKHVVGQSLIGRGYMVKYEYPLVDSLVKGYRHKYDVVGFKDLVVVEVDDPDLHAKPFKKKNDRIAKNHLLDEFEYAHFIRLNKDEISSLDTRGEYMEAFFYPKI